VSTIFLVFLNSCSEHAVSKPVLMELVSIQ